MKYKLLPMVIAVSSAAIYSSTVFSGDLTVYGKINLAYDQVEKVEDGATVEDKWDLETFNSRLGFKGSEEINDDLKVIYKLEYRVVPDGESDVFKGRNSYVGLQGSFGTILAGKHDTPLKMSQGKVDAFNDLTNGDIFNSIVGENRENDIIMFTTPKISNFSVTVAIMPGETTYQEDDGFADQISAAATYKNDSLYVALAVDDNVKGLDIVRLTGTYALGDLSLGAMYQTAEDASSGNEAIGDNVKGPIKEVLSDYDNDVDEQESVMISAKYKMGKFTVKGQYVDSTFEGPADEFDSEAMSIGLDYKLSKRTRLYTYFSEITVDTPMSEYKYTTLGLAGIEHKF